MDILLGFIKSGAVCNSGIQPLQNEWESIYEQVIINTGRKWEREK